MNCIHYLHGDKNGPIGEHGGLRVVSEKSMFCKSPSIFEPLALQVLQESGGEGRGGGERNLEGNGLSFQPHHSLMKYRDRYREIEGKEWREGKNLTSGGNNNKRK